MLPAGAAPQRLGRYEILRPLARGGMAELFLARATGIQGFEKLVVVKRILPELQGDAELLRMFLDEARLAANLHHSNIAQVYDIGEDGGVPFFSMEFLHGEDLRQVGSAVWKHGERLPLEHALSVIIGVCAGLHYAHEKRDSDGKPLGIVHRDVSPPNVIITWDGGIKVVDFGVAKAQRRLTETRHGTLKGKLTYMSPEQCLGEEVDRRSDVFAISILLWELVTGRRLFGGKSDFSVMKSIIERDAPLPSLVWKECPPELDTIVGRGLRRTRDTRYQTAEELQLALEDFARERRLALSPVGLARCMKELFGARAQAAQEAEREGAEALVSLVASTIEARVMSPSEDAVSRATMFDGEIVVTPAPGRYTRAVARRPRRARLLVAAAGVAVATAIAAGGIALRLRKLAVAELPTPPGVRKVQPIGDPSRFTPGTSEPGAKARAGGAAASGEIMAPGATVGAGARGGLTASAGATVGAGARGAIAAPGATVGAGARGAIAAPGATVGAGTEMRDATAPAGATSGAAARGAVTAAGATSGAGARSAITPAGASSGARGAIVAPGGASSGARARSEVIAPGEGSRARSAADTARSVADTAGTSASSTAESGAGATQPGAGATQPGAGATQPGAGATQPGAGATQPGAGATQPGAGATQPGAESPANAADPTASAKAADPATSRIAGPSLPGVEDAPNARSANAATKGSANAPAAKTGKAASRGSAAASKMANAAPSGARTVVSPGATDGDPAAQEALDRDTKHGAAASTSSLHSRKRSRPHTHKKGSVTLPPAVDLDAPLPPK